MSDEFLGGEFPDVENDYALTDDNGRRWETTDEDDGNRRVAGDSGQPATVQDNVVSSVSAYRARKERHDADTELMREFGGKTVEEVLAAYHADTRDTPRRRWLRDEAFFRVFFLLPYALKKRYYLPADVFNDAVQNMACAVLVAIEKFRPERGYTFVNYLPGYLKSGVTKSLRDMYVVSAPNVRKKILIETLDALDYEPCREQEANEERLCRKSVGRNEKRQQYVDVCVEHGDHVSNMRIDYDEIVHNRQLVEWLEEALSAESDVLSEDERRLLILHNGLFGNRPHSYQEISRLRAAEGKGSACSRLSQINTAAIRKLREFFRDMNIEEF